jgi:hypothetical protein
MCLSKCNLHCYIVARQAPGIMRAGVGVRANATGAADIFNYVLADPKTAIKSQKDSDGSADFCESVGRLGLMVGVAAQAAADMAPPPPREHAGTAVGAAVGGVAGGSSAGATEVGGVPYGGVLRAAANAFTTEALANAELVPKVAAALDTALGSCAL